MKAKQTMQAFLYGRRMVKDKMILYFSFDFTSLSKGCMEVGHRLSWRWFDDCQNISKVNTFLRFLVKISKENFSSSKKSPKIFEIFFQKFFRPQRKDGPSMSPYNRAGLRNERAVKRNINFNSQKCEKVPAGRGNPRRERWTITRTRQWLTLLRLLRGSYGHGYGHSYG